MLATTPDAFQGRESKVVVLVLCATKTTGPLAAAEAHRLCVAVTRHIGALFVVRDVLTVRAGVKGWPMPERMVMESGEHVLVTRGAFRRCVEYFRRMGRIVRAGSPVSNHGSLRAMGQGRRGYGGMSGGASSCRGVGGRMFWAGVSRGVGEKGNDSF